MAEGENGVGGSRGKPATTVHTIVYGSRGVGIFWCGGCPGILFASGMGNNIIGVDICRTVVLLLLNDVFIPADVGHAPRPIEPQ